ncbi:MAG: tetratricopeptide repeat protein [Treponema sp.]|nr:tetratricopeptide repeat protein [Treponema sp.]
MLFSILIAGIIFLVLIVVLVLFAGKKSSSSGKTSSNRNKSQAQIVKTANRKLDRNPNDPEALAELADLYLNNKMWDKAFTIYDKLFRLADKDPRIDPFKAVLRCGICSLNLDHLQEAVASLSAAYKLNPHDFDVNYNVGVAMFKDKQYDKAIPCLKKALVANPEAEGVYLILGQCYYYGHHYRDSLPCFKKALTEDPNNKEALFDMADSMSAEGHGDKAIKVFMHLRPDPVYGARSCLEAGSYHMKTGDYDSAIQDFEIGTKHQNIPQELLLDLEYKSAQCYFNKGDFSKGLQLLNKIRSQSSNYKDVNALASRYQELSQNRNLQVYLSSGASDFVALCRKFIEGMYKGATIKILDINVGPAFTDIFAEVDSAKWHDSELFRFFRTSGSTGELYVQDFHGHMHDVKAERGFCVTAGIFSEEAHKYIEGRPLDLVEKPLLTKILKQIQL